MQIKNEDPLLFLGEVLYIVKHGVIIDSVDEVYSR